MIPAAVPTIAPAISALPIILKFRFRVSIARGTITTALSASPSASRRRTPESGGAEKKVSRNGASTQVAAASNPARIRLSVATAPGRSLDKVGR